MYCLAGGWEFAKGVVRVYQGASLPSLALGAWAVLEAPPLQAPLPASQGWT